MQPKYRLHAAAGLASVLRAQPTCTSDRACMYPERVGGGCLFVPVAQTRWPGCDWGWRGVGRRWKQKRTWKEKEESLGHADRYVTIVAILFPEDLF
jgi:hypothetical protein